jgi:hypothetical protein
MAANIAVIYYSATGHRGRARGGAAPGARLTAFTNMLTEAPMPQAVGAE